MSEISPRDELLAVTETAQALASNPEVSAWVSANAGAGKTHVLKLRVLRLLLAGTPPERILCLTYTKAAAAEMSKRVFDDLAKWTTSDDDNLRATIHKLTGALPDEADLAFARQLFARAIETPGGLKVQTIHAFCERLLQRFPLEADVAPGFTILDDQTAAALLRAAVDQTLVDANSAPGSELGKALRCAVSRAADDRFDMLLGSALRHRLWLREIAEFGAASPGDWRHAAEKFYRQAFGVAQDLTSDNVQVALVEILSDEKLRVAAQVLEDGGKLDRELAGKLSAAANASDGSARISIFADAFLTQAGAPRSDSRFVSKGIREAEPVIAGFLADARDRFHELKQQWTALETIEATLALAHLGQQVLAHYEAAKDRRAALDFEDLIVKTAGLLGQSAAADWILYKLDGGLDHILVDEAQDTSPLQWRVIEAMAAEFYSGEGASEILRTVFAVGDEKQSIYSFQGAAPEQFARAGQRFSQLAKDVNREWAAVPLTLSFRTVTPLLEAVDAIFSDDRRTPGINVSGGDICHEALRIGEAGRFEIWPTVAPESVEPTPAFAPLDEAASGVPSQILAEQIADRIRLWLDSGELLASEGRPVQPGDFLILVRRRRPFAPEMVRALKARNIPVAGADRIILTEQIAVQDLMALGDFLVLPEDDLALASVLKSPLFNLDDDDFLKFAPSRPGSLWSALLGAAREDEKYSPAAEQLKKWRALSDFAPPYEFFASLLDRDGCRDRLVGRLGPDAADPLDEFMNLALAFDEQAPASLQGFLCWLREGRREIKREADQGRQEVRVMTVHGAKGLEAPIVILPDTCSAPGGGNVSPLVDLGGAEMPGQQQTLLAWAIKGSRSLRPVADGRAVASQREIEEHNRLLYVALTRAQDRLYVTGFETKTGRQKGCWYDAIVAGTEGQLTELKGRDGQTFWRRETEQAVAPALNVDVDVQAGTAEPLPEWAHRRAPSEPQLAIPLAPSRLSPLETDSEGEPQPFTDIQDRAMPADEPKSPSPRASLPGDKFQRGLLTHALLEHLPGYPAADREEIAAEFLEFRGERLGARARASIVAEVLTILDDETFAPVFGPDSRAEVPIVAEISRPEGGGPPLRLNGVIDRLARTRDGILIVDYKTNRNPPARVDQVPEVYLLQMAAYRLALARIFPEEPIRAALIWTADANLMALPDNRLDDHQQRLWDLRTGDLDAA